MDWFQSVKIFYGFVVMFFFLEVKIINEYGIYNVGCYNEDESLLLVSE